MGWRAMLYGAPSTTSDVLGVSGSPPGEVGRFCHLLTFVNRIQKTSHMSKDPNRIDRILSGMQQLTQQSHSQLVE